jgi:hypothetical protein
VSTATLALPPPPLAGCMADPAPAPATRAEVRVRDGVGVPLGTYPALVVGVASLHVDPLGHGFQMIWTHVKRRPAQVVDHQAGRDRAVRLFVGTTMRQAPTGDAVPPLTDWPRPEPAALGDLYLQPEVRELSTERDS